MRDLELHLCVCATGMSTQFNLKFKLQPQLERAFKFFVCAATHTNAIQGLAQPKSTGPRARPSSGPLPSQINNTRAGLTSSAILVLGN